MTSAASAAPALIERWVRPIADWPQPGVTFRDVTPLLAQPEAFDAVIDALAEQVRALGPVDALLGVEARGFILAAPLALRLGIGFVPVRKAGKLPAECVSAEYELEYGTARIEMHADALQAGQQVVVIDDVLATGGTLEAAASLVDAVGAEVVGHLVMIELAALGGRARLAAPVSTIQTY